MAQQPDSPGAGPSQHKSTSPRHLDDIVHTSSVPAMLALVRIAIIHEDAGPVHEQPLQDVQRAARLERDRKRHELTTDSVPYLVNRSALSASPTQGEQHRALPIAPRPH